jgi:hypothetical protein
MIGTTLAGITFVNFNELDIKSGDEVEISIDKDIQDDETPYVVKHKGIKTIGYIPKLMTIAQWGIDARARGDLDSYNYNRDRYVSVKIVRDNLYTDMNRNHQQVVLGWISRIVRDEDDNVKSVGIVLDYM